MPRTHVEVEPEDETIACYEVTVDWTFSPFDPGVTNGPAEKCYPPEGGDLEECVVTFADGTSPRYGEQWLRDTIGDGGFETAEELARSEDEGY